MSTWWWRNRWFLLAIVVLLPAAVAVSMMLRWFPYVDSRPQPEHVALGDTVRYSGADIELTRLEVLDGVRWNAPVGTDVVVATLDVDVLEPADSLCTVVVVSDEAGFERSWDSEFYSDSDYEVPDSHESQCRLSESGAYTLHLTFLVPAGEVHDPVVELTSAAALPRVLRLS